MSAFSFRVAKEVSRSAVRFGSPLSASAAVQGWLECAVVRRLPRVFLLEFGEMVRCQKARGLGRAEIF
jgi:hypothetical protein